MANINSTSEISCETTYLFDATKSIEFEKLFDDAIQQTKIKNMTNRTPVLKHTFKINEIDMETLEQIKENQYCVVKFTRNENSYVALYRKDNLLYQIDYIMYQEMIDHNRYNKIIIKSCCLFRSFFI